MRHLTIVLTAAVVVASVAAQAAPARHARGHAQPRDWPTPDRFFAQALCVHSGWVYEAARGPHRRRGLLRRLRHGPDYFNGATAFYRTYQVGNGEAAWDEVNSYGGGMQMTLYTYNRAAGLSHHRLPYASSNTAVSRLPPRAQIYAAYLIVRSDHGSWREWPQTSRACGYT